jgi:cytochrome c-type biogenesis protein CcmH
MKRIVYILLLMFCATQVVAVEPDEILSDPVLEARAREISAGVRCVVCQNEPIDTSNASVAKDLRLLVRERLLAGDTNAEVEAFLVARYGDYVLFRPPFRGATYVLWFAPVLIFSIGLLAVTRAVRNRSTAPAFDQLSDEELARLSQIMSAKDDDTA